MSRTDTWMPLYIGDYLSDTGRLTTIGHGAYLLILMDYWRNGPPPDDNSALAAIARVDRKTWDRELKGVIRSFFRKGDDGLLHQKRLDHEREHAIDLSNKRRAAALKKNPPQETVSPANGGANGAGGDGHSTNGRGANGGLAASNSSAIADANGEQTDPMCMSNQGVNCEDNSGHTRASHAYALPSPSPLQLPKKELELRSGADAPLPNARDRLRGEGVAQYREITGCSEKDAFSQIGRLCKSANNHYGVVLEAIGDAVNVRPLNMMAFMTEAIARRMNPKKPYRNGFLELIHEEGIGASSTPPPDPDSGVAAIHRLLAAEQEKPSVH